MNRSRLTLCILLLCLFAFPGFALVDLVGPADGMTTNSTTVNFDYYVSMQAMQGCSLNLQGQQFQDLDVQPNALNSIQMQNLVSGAYSWNMSCTNGTVEYSAMRTFAIDTVAPTVTLLSPQQGSTAKTLAVDFIPYDDVAASLSCQVLWNNVTLETATVARNTHYVKNYTATPGNGTLMILCSDAAGNTASANRSMTLLPDYSLQLNLDKSVYGLSEAPVLTINTISGANVSVDICPDQAGFVQCTSALIVSTSFPQTVTLPITNHTGSYIVDGMASYGGQTKFNRSNYNVTNTIQVTVQRSATPLLNTTVNFTATVAGGIAPYRFVWQLKNGTTVQGVSVVSIAHDAPGNYTHFLTAYDQANNSKTVNITYVVDPVYSTIFQLSDDQTNEPIVDAAIDITYGSTNKETEVRTIQGGLAYADLQEGTNRVFISAPNYEYFVEEYYLNSSTTIPIKLTRMPSTTPQVTITAPANQGTTGTTATISYVVNHTLPVTCTLLFGDQNNWFKQNGSMQGSQGSFVRELTPGSYQVRIECTDAKGKTGSSSVVQFTSAEQGAQTTPTAQPYQAQAEEEQLQNTVAQLDTLLTNLDSYGQKEKEAIGLLGVDKQVRNTKRAVQQAIRDINDLQYRNDLDDAAKLAERKRILEGVDKVIAATPVDVKVLDTKSYVKYLKEEDMTKVAADLHGLGGITADEKTIARRLWEDQQKFTVSTKIMQIEEVYADQSTSTATVVTRSFTYAAGIAPEYQIYEIVPKEIAKSAKDLTIMGKSEVLKEDPVLRFGQEQNITYIIPRKVDFTLMESAKTVIAKPYPEEKSIITGFAIFGADDIKSVGWPVIALVLFIIIAYLVYYFDLIKLAKRLSYRFGKKEKMHYVNVLINDAVSQLDANDYDRAEMIYKEVRMTYDALPVPAKNELYDDVMSLVHRMDAYYFNLVMLELDAHLKSGEMEQAISSYEKLTHIFERLDTDRQEQLITAVAGMGKRLGLGVSA